MKIVPSFLPSGLSLAVFLGLNAALNLLAADAALGTVKVTAILGLAQVSKGDGPAGPLGPGMVLRQGHLIKTAAGSAVDLEVGGIHGTIRLTQNSILALEKLPAAPAKEDEAKAAFEMQLNLRRGELLGESKEVPTESRFEIKVSNGIARILKGRYRIDAQGMFVVLEGQALFAYVPTVGEAEAHALNAPPAVYFSAGAGVQSAPKQLQKEVAGQMRSKLPRR